jgi:hypothetical protein
MAIPFERISPDRPIADLLRFLAAWLGEPAPEYRIPDASIPAFVPPPLRAVYAFAGQWPERYPEQWFDDGATKGLFQIQDSLRRINELERKGERLVFLDENLGCWSCETLASAANPPVWCNREGEEELVSDRLSHFLVTFCLREIVYGSQYVLTAHDVTSPADLVRGAVEPLWTGGRYVQSKATDVFVTEARLLLMHQFGWWLGFDRVETGDIIVPGRELRVIRRPAE